MAYFRTGQRVATYTNKIVIYNKDVEKIRDRLMKEILMRLAQNPKIYGKQLFQMPKIKLPDDQQKRINYLITLGTILDDFDVKRYSSYTIFDSNLHEEDKPFRLPKNVKPISKYCIYIDNIAIPHELNIYRAMRRVQRKYQLIYHKESPSIHEIPEILTTKDIRKLYHRPTKEDRLAPLPKAVSIHTMSKHHQKHRNYHPSLDTIPAYQLPASEEFYTILRTDPLEILRMEDEAAMERYRVNQIINECLHC